MIKVSIDIIENDIKSNETKYLEEFLNKLEDINFEKVILSDESCEVAVYIACYIAKKLIKKPIGLREEILFTTLFPTYTSTIIKKLLLTL